VMGCGDAGHILLSKRVADDLGEYEHWRPLLHDLGECEVKHGVKLQIVNLCTDEAGNRALPAKLRAQRQGVVRKRWILLAASLVLLAAVVAAFVAVSRRAARSSSPVPEKSIAVLPFENLSEDMSNAYFAEGIQEEILTRLAKIADLKVISRTSTQNYKSKPGNLSEIAKQLGVANILEGSVQKTADQVRVNVQLIHAPSDSHRWADTYDRKLIDIFAVESEVAKAIAESLQAKLSVREEQALTVKPTNNPEAYDAYLRGLAFDARSWYSSDNSDKAASFYERAVQLDPIFALSWGRLSRTEAFRYFIGEDTTPARRDAAERALNITQKLQPNAPETMLAQAFYQYWILRDYELAKETFGRARKLLPGNTDIPSALAAIARRQGHWEESIAHWEQTLALDPRNSAWLTQEAITFMVLRQFPDALKTFDRALDIIPNDPELIEFKAQIYQAEGDLEQAARLLAQIPSPAAFGTKIYQLFLERRYEEAIRLLQVKPAESRSVYSQVTLAFAQQLAGDTTAAKVTAQQAREKLEPLCQKDPANPQLAQMFSQAYALLGQKAEALKEAERARTLLPSAKDAMVGPYYEENLARIQTRLGENDRAIAALQHLLTVPHGYVPITPALLRLDPMFDPLRNDPRFQKLVASPAPK
jgi:TolB-like protein/Flp pilus assembly protein TadD